MLPNSIAHLSQLQTLNLCGCENLQTLPSSIGQLTALTALNVAWCERLEALPESINLLSRLQFICLWGCSSINLSTILEHMINFPNCLYIDLATEGQLSALAQLNVRVLYLFIRMCSDEAINVLDGLDVLKNVHHLSWFCFCYSHMTKLPKTIGFLTNLNRLDLYECWELRKLPNSIGQLKMLKRLWLRKCYSLETLSDSLGALIRLQVLWIVECVSLIKLPTSLGHLSRLWVLWIEGCGKLQQLPECVRKLDVLKALAILDCGNLEEIGVVRVVQGLHIWGCTSVTKLPGSSLMVVDNNFWNPAWNEFKEEPFHDPVRRGLRELQVVEENDCGLLRLIQEYDHGRVMWQRIHKMSCYRLRMVSNNKVHHRVMMATSSAEDYGARKYYCY